MSTSFGGRVRLVLAFIFVCSIAPWSYSGASASDSTPESEPTTVVEAPTEVVEVPTEVPVVPTTEPSVAVEPSVTLEPTVAPTETAIPTATTEPEIFAADTINFLTVRFLVCRDSNRTGQSALNFAYGEFAAASTSDYCSAAVRPFPGITVTVTLTSAADPLIVHSFTFVDDDPYEYDFGNIEEGIYEVSYESSDSASIPDHAFPELVTLSAGYNHQVYIEYFVADEAPVLIPDSTVDFTGYFRACRDDSRAGQTDFLVALYFASESADECQIPPGYGTASLMIQQIDGLGVPIGDPIVRSSGYDGSFVFDDIPTGIYIATESVYENVSDPFVLDGSGGAYPSIYIRNFFAVEPDWNSSFSVGVSACHDPERAGTVDYFAVEISGIGGSESCLILEDYFAAPIEVTVRDSEANVVAVVLVDGDGTISVPNIEPGTYTVQLDGFAESEPIDVAEGDIFQVSIIAYVDDPEDLPEPGGTEYTSLAGAAQYCESTDLDGQIHYLIDVEFTAVSTGECVGTDELLNHGEVTLYRYDNTGDAEPAQSWIAPVINSRFEFYYNDMVPGYYRLGFSSSSFEAPTVLSDEFPLLQFETSFASILVFEAPSDVAALVIRKDICYSAERAGTSEFYIHQDGGDAVFQGSDNTIQCYFPLAWDGDYTFTLNNLDTGTSSIATQLDTQYQHFIVGAVPPGNYTLTEEIGGISVTSDPFVIDSVDEDYTVVVRNYIDGEPEIDEDEGGTLRVMAYDCVNEAKAGSFEFFFIPDPYQGEGRSSDASGSAFEASAGLIENCVPAEQYAFEIENDEPEGSVSAAAVTPLFPTDPPYVHAPSEDVDFGDLPVGEYVIRETTTGAESDPVIIDANQNYAYFYRFADAPTPTPTETPEPTATNTPEPTATSTPPTTTPTATRPGDPDPTSTPGNPTTLPSTGQGQPQAWDGMLRIMLLAGLAMVLLAAGVRRSSRK